MRRKTRRGGERGGDADAVEGIGGGWRRVGDGTSAAAADDDEFEYERGGTDRDGDDNEDGGEGGGAAGEDEKEEAPRWAVASALFALHAAAAGCAVMLRSLQLALDIIGATCGVLIAFVLPGVLFFAAFRGGKGGGPGLAWAGRWTHHPVTGALTRGPGRACGLVAATLVVCGIATSACGIAATLMEIL